MSTTIHQLSLRHFPRWFWYALAITAVEILSYSGWVFPVINNALFILLCIVTATLSFKRLEWGVAILATELIIGSKGYLFSYQILEATVSIRLALFAIVFIVGLYWILKQRTVAILHWKLWWPYVGLVALVLLGIVIGSIHNDLGTLFLDMNGYLYLGAAVPLIQAIRTQEQWKQLCTVSMVAVSMVTIKTAVVVVLFAHDLSFLYSLPGIYKWIRDTGVGEITRFPNGFVRVFFQNHLLVIAAFFILWTHAFSPLQHHTIRAVARQQPWVLAAVMATAAVIVLSYSRSFWVSVVVTTACIEVWCLYQYRSWRVLARIATQMLLIAGGSALIITVLIRVPLPGQKDISLLSLISERTSDISSEPAASSRWQLLQPLLQNIRKHPLLGSGFGATLTYTSNDPRVREVHADGQYTTYAFEWGYLDLLYKVGIIGSALYAYFFWQLGRAALRNEWKKNQHTNSGPIMTALLVLLLVTHVFTPYLNHPLGIGLLLFIALWTTKAQETTHT